MVALSLSLKAGVAPKSSWTAIHLVVRGVRNSRWLPPVNRDGEFSYSAEVEFRRDNWDYHIRPLSFQFLGIGKGWTFIHPFRVGSCLAFDGYSEMVSSDGVHLVYLGEFSLRAFLSGVLEDIWHIPHTFDL